MLLFWSSKVGAESSECGGILGVQSEDQQAEHSDVLLFDDNMKDNPKRGTESELENIEKFNWEM